MSVTLLRRGSRYEPAAERPRHDGTDLRARCGIIMAVCKSDRVCRDFLLVVKRKPVERVHAILAKTALLCDELSEITN